MLRWLSRFLSPEGKGLSREEAAQPESFARASNAFAFDLYRHVGETTGNLAFSPASISIAMAMTWAGARGETADQIANTLRFARLEDVHREAAQLLSRWDEPAPGGFRLRVVNRLFGEETYDFLPSFIELTSERYSAPLEALDFRGQPEEARARVNAWVAARTDERIQDLLAPGSIGPDTSLVVANALYFLADWLHPFEPRSTHSADFHLLDGQTVPVDMMVQKKTLARADVGPVRLVELEYKESPMVMTIVLPKRRSGLAKLEKTITSAKLEGWIERLTLTETVLLLPKFRVEPPDPLELKPVLTQMGIADAFDPQRADFTGIADPPDPADRLVISEVFHKALVDVDERGTEAAAATAVVMALAGALPAPTPELRVDRPFLFFIRDRPSGILLFMGRVSDPRSR